MGRAFWILALGRFISALGDGFFFPFTALYLTRVHGVPPEQVGIAMSIAGFASLLGRLPGGGLTDRYGFKTVAVVGLLGAGSAIIAAGIAPTVWLFVVAYSLESIFTWGSFPALMHGAALMVAADRREEAFSILNVLSNAGISLGPILGTYLVARDYSLIFWLDGLTFFAFALLVAFGIPALREEANQPGRQGGRGTERPPVLSVYLPPLSARRFWRVALSTALVAVAYSQLGSSLPINIERQFGSVAWYGLLWTLNGLMIAVLQFPGTRWLENRDRRQRMAVGALLHGAGVLVILAALELHQPAGVFVAMTVITLGEILYAPLPPTEFAESAPPGLGGRYQGAGSIANGVGWAVGPLVGGLLLGRMGPVALWGSMAACALTAALVLQPFSQQASRSRSIGDQERDESQRGQSRSVQCEEDP